MSAATQRVQPPLPIVTQRGCATTDGAAALMRRVFRPPLKPYVVPGVSLWGIARARNGCETNAIYRLACLFVGLRKAGAPMSAALEIMDALREVIERLWLRDAALATREDIEAIASRAEETVADINEYVRRLRRAQSEEAAA